MAENPAELQASYNVNKRFSKYCFLGGAVFIDSRGFLSGHLDLDGEPDGIMSLGKY
ncbi:hypothetical protein [Paenibacillus sp. J2TS4]|uniref:hypothetical protein n=1 Tax=Paenibacillus sp. J2TS4 TaxID=2807194 RepID=UPI001BCFF44E|nr:hypothetical protein [Paenibacillus sp. J2TS4]